MLPLTFFQLGFWIVSKICSVEKIQCSISRQSWYSINPSSSLRRFWCNSLVIRMMDEFDHVCFSSPVGRSIFASISTNHIRTFGTSSSSLWIAQCHTFWDLGPKFVRGCNYWPIANATLRGILLLDGFSLRSQAKSWYIQESHVVTGFRTFSMVPIY